MQTSNLHHFLRQNRTKISTFLSPSYILMPDCWWTPDSPGKTHTFEEEVQLKRSMTNSIYTSLQLLSVLVFLGRTLPRHVLPPAIYWPAVISILGIMSYIVYRDWIRIMKVESSKYAEIWRTSGGTILGNFRETIRKKFDLLYYNVNIVLLVLVEFWMRFVRMESVRLAFKFGGWEPTRQVSF